MPRTFTVYGADGRRIIRNADEAYANEFANKLANDTGEKLRVVEDEATDEVGIGDIGPDVSEEKAALLRDTRPELDKRAKKAGVENPAELENKEAVADAILAAEATETP